MKVQTRLLRILNRLTDKNRSNWIVVDYEINKKEAKKYITIDAPSVKGQYVIYINC
tara:strand:- start:8 stop:175 length:168 start_codon:yes stop_codon:yes gene_type:complete